MKRTLILISCTMLAALVCLVILITVAGLPNDKKNGFNRQWLSINAHKQMSSALSFKAERLFGTADALYLSSPSHQQVYRLDRKLRISDTITLNINKPLKPPVNFFAYADHIYVHEYNSGMLFSKDAHTKSVDSFKLSSAPFVKSAMLSDSIVVIRGFEAGSSRPFFIRINTNSGERYKSDLLSGRADAGFSSDGILCTDAKKTHLFYIPYFENGIYCIDSQMKLKYKQATIDTVFNNNIQVTQRGSGEMQKIYASAPRAKVNKRAFANDHLLFIESDLRADNEDDNAFRQYPVLDTYHLETGTYAGSFYIPVDKRKVLSYYLSGEQLYVLSSDELALYVLNK
ncbi:hypothetical protein [Chitinophaga pinensis]|uniref:Uncharacterized protein n=1 Tax=Chitinophaga pinensis TaxID=79329 RepID=A0A5C6LJG9_9BACT|nr:hypothetical protein [Chitinophaga pinensis]TWV89430.1 hypothetical protein FEF09_29955 [Chitinophaga pinensis]